MLNAKKQKIFLVDDDGLHNQMLKDHLTSKLNISITTFSSGEDCLNNLDQKPDVIVLDYNLDREKKGAQNGLEVLKKIKSGNPEIEVIMLSGQDKIETAVEIMKYGAFEYVIKNTTEFVRAQNSVLNIFKNLQLQENLKAYKFAVALLSTVIVAIVITAAILEVTGMTVQHPGWF